MVLGTHLREGEVGHNEKLEGRVGDTPGSQTVLTQLQRIAEQARNYPSLVFNNLYHLIELANPAVRHIRGRKHDDS